MINGLLQAGAEIHAFDPEAIETTKAMFGDKISYGSDPYDVLPDADALAVCTEWHEFRGPDYDGVRELMKNPLVFDGRNLFRPEKMKQFGWEYYSIGRPSPEQGE